MARGDTQARNHPQKGSAIKVEPIRDRQAISHIKSYLRHKNLRDLCLFTLGINTAYRANELLSLTVGQVAHLRAGDLLDIKQSKNGKYRATTLNRISVEAVQDWLDYHPMRDRPSAPLFPSKQRNREIGVSALNHMVKDWCTRVELSGNFGSHTLRKTWGYHQRIYNNAPIPLLMIAYGHATQAQTMSYLSIQEDELRNLYISMEL